MTATYIYWIATGLLAALYLSSAALYVARAGWVRETLAGLGYPAYLVPFMAAVKVAGAVAIVWRPGPMIADLAYAGIPFHLILSGMAHLGVRKPAGAVPAIVGLALLAASFGTQNTARDIPSPYAPVARR